jgi:Domain of Unknown Function (DUF1259)
MRKTVHLILALLAVGCASPALADEADWQQVKKALGVSGSMEPGDIYRVSLPRSDLKVTADGVQVKPAFALGSWLAFKKAGEDTMVMGDLVLTEDEVNPVVSKLEEAGIQVTALHHHLDNLTPDVIRALQEQGIQVTALHNHMLKEEPRLFFMHFWANDDAQKLARGLRAALDQMNVEKS